MILSSTEIKQQLMDLATSNAQDNLPTDFKEKMAEHIELGNAIKRMTTTKGWKILESWLSMHIKIPNLLSPDDKIRREAQEMGRAIAMILAQVQYWIMLGEKAEESKEEPES